MANPLEYIGAGLSGVGSVASAIISNSQAKKNAQQAFENQKKLMALQQQYAVENWNRENNYNTPSAQKERLVAAGLNPDLMYGNGATGLQAGSIASPTAPSAPMAQTVSFSNAVSDAVLAAQGIAAAKKAGAETIGKEIENDFNQKTLDDRIKKAALDNKWTEQQIKKAEEEVNNLQQQYGMLVAQQNILSTERQIRDKQLSQIDERFDKEMRDFDDKHKLSKEEYRRLRNSYDDFKRMMSSNADKAEWDAKLSELVYNNENNFQEWERSAGLLGQFVGMFAKLLRLAK